MKAAEGTLRDLVTRDPEDANALNSLGYMLAERGERLDEAVQLVQRALKIEPDNPSFLDSLGWAYFQQGRLDQADAAADAGGREAPEQLRRAGAPRRSPIQAAALRRRGIRLGTRALGRRPVNRPSQDREEAPRRTLPHGPAVIPSSRAVGICRAARRGGAWPLCVSSRPAAPKAPALPSGGGAAFPDAAAAYAEATSQCRGVRTLSAELALSGRAGRQKLRGRILGGFAEPGHVRLEAPAPFGRPVFTLVVRDGTATLVLNRDRRVAAGRAAGGAGRGA